MARVFLRLVEGLCVDRGDRNEMMPRSSVGSMVLVVEDDDLDCCQKFTRLYDQIEE